MSIFRSRFFQSPAWRILLGISVLAVVVISLIFSYNTATQLRQSERQRMEVLAEALRGIANTDDPTLHLYILASNTTIPVLLADDGGKVIDAFNYGDKDPMRDAVFFESELASLRSSGNAPIVIEDGNMYKNYIYYRPSQLIAQLGWFPYIQFSLLGVFLLLAYLTWSSNRLAEQERVWVGMSKETAHQLGTPITSLIGWVENLHAMYPDDEQIQMIAQEIGKDVTLLETVAERFSKIGAIPELKPYNLYDLLDILHDYIRQRAPRKVQFVFPERQAGQPVWVLINPTLFRWVLENLLKNALDAMEGKGEIRISLEETAKQVILHVRDTGKGIPRNAFKRVFSPGFTTKKRGWGLGLSLCKRIVEQYHRGKIFVADSVLGEGTTFQIQIQKAAAEK